MKTRSEVYQSLQPQLQTFDKERLAIKTKTRKRLYLFWFSIVFCIALLFPFAQGPDLKPLWVMFLFCSFICTATYRYYHRLKKRYYNAYAGRLIAAIVQGIEPSIQHSNKEYILMSDFVNSHLYPEKIDCYDGRDLLQGRLGSTDFELSKVHAQYTTTDRNFRTDYHTIFEGIFMRADFHKHFSGQTFVLTDTLEKKGEWMSNLFQGDSNYYGRLIRMENVDFEKEFMVYTSDEVEARYILSPDMLERILALKKKLNCDIQLSFINSLVNIAIPSYSILEVNTNISPLNPSVVYTIYDHLKICFDIIEDLNLNTRIWSKQKQITT